MAGKKKQEKREKKAAAKAKMQQQASGKIAKKKVRKAQKRTLLSGKVFIKSTFNNTLVTITDDKGEVVSWSSSGRVGFKGSKKSTPYAASLAAKSAASKAVDMGMTNANIFVQGVGAGRDAAIRSLDATGLHIGAIQDITPLPHNGPRPRKARRV